MRTLLLLASVAACTPIATRPVLPPPIPDDRAARDPVHTGDVGAIHGIAEHTLRTLVAALDDTQRRSLTNLTLAFGRNPGDVNAYATCSAETGAPLVAVTNGLLEIARQLAIARATDETYGTEHAHAYTQWIAKHPGAVAPPDPMYGADGRTLELARVLFVEELAYIIGHELAHHYLGHLGCSGEHRIAPPDIPLFSQTDELAADAGGIANTLEVGRTTGWTEAGAVLVLQFFRSGQTPGEVVFAFEQSHPLAEVRLPTVTATADLWRATDGHL